jgi:hypothetical protein
MRKLILELKRLNITITEKTPWCVHEDGSIILGGAYDGIHIQVGRSYYHVVSETEGGRFRFVKGAGRLEDELKQAMA